MYIPKTLLFLYLCVCLMAAAWIFGREQPVSVVVEISSTRTSNAQLFYDQGRGMSEQASLTIPIQGRGLDNFQLLIFPLEVHRLIVSALILRHGIAAREKGAILPGWRVLINGVPHPVFGYEIFQSISTPAGESTVTFEYSPTHSILSLLGSCWLLLTFGRWLGLRLPVATRSLTGSLVE